VSRLLDLVMESFDLPETPNKAEKKAKLTKEDVAKRGEEKLQQLAEQAKPTKSGSTNQDQKIDEAEKEAPNELDLTNPKLKEMDDNEPDELENVPASKKTKEGYLKDGFVVDDNYVMGEEQKRRITSKLGSQLGDASDKKELQDSPPKFLGQRNGDKKAYIDEYSTPESVTQILVDNYLKANYRPAVKIWEIACGSEQKIVKCLQQAGFTNVTYSDIQGEAIGVTKHDFLEQGQGLYGAHEYELIITNPPWSQNKAFIYKAMELGKPFIFLVKLEVLGTVYMRNFVLNSNYSFFSIPVLDRKAFVNPKTQQSIQVGHVCWLIGFPRPATMVKCPEVALKYSAIPAVEEPVSRNR